MMTNRLLIVMMLFLFFLHSSVSFFEFSEIYEGKISSSKFVSVSPKKNIFLSDDQQAYVRDLVQTYLKNSPDPITSLYNEKITRETVREFFIKTTKSEDITNTILFYAEKENLPIGVVFSLVFVESSFRPSTVNHTNANNTKDFGLFQLNSNTFRHFSKEDFFNLDTNVKAGVGYLKYAFSLDPNPQIALAIYNAGPSRPLRGKTPESTKLYVSRILTYSQKLESEFAYYMKQKFFPTQPST